MTGCGGGSTGSSGGSTGSSGEAPSSSGTGNLAGDSAVPEGARLAEHINIINNESQLTIVNPMSAAGTGGPSAWANILVYDRLLSETEPGVFAPMLATEWHTDDYQTFTFKLRNDVYFHNGDHFTANDVVWMCEITKETPASPTFSRWNIIDTITAIDDYNLKIVLKEPYMDYFLDVSRNNYCILNRTAYNKNPDDPTWAFIGTGPFKIAGFESNNYITFERFDDYWGEAPPTKSMTFWTVPEMSTRIVKLKNKEAQVSFQMPPEDLDIISKDPDFQLFPILINEPGILGFNDQGDATITDKNFRLAVAHAIDSEETTLVALGNWGTVPWDGNLWGPDTQFRLEGLAKREYNLDLAKEYLAKSPYKGETLEIITSSPHNTKAAEVVQMQLERIGVKTNIQQMDHAAIIAALIWDPDSKVQMHTFAMPMSPIVSSVMSSHTSRPNNRLNFADPLLYEIANKYKGTADVKEREELAHQLQEHWYELIPAIPLFYRLQPVTTVKGIGGLKLYSDVFIHNMRGIYWDLNQTPANMIP